MRRPWRDDRSSLPRERGGVQPDPPGRRPRPAMTALLVVATAQLALFVCVCGAILWELRRARLEANARGEKGKQLLETQQEIELLVEDELRKIRKATREPTGVIGDGA